MDLAWLSLLALLVVVAVSCTTRVNPGIVAIVLAWVIALYAAPWFGPPLDLQTVATGFPADLFLTLVGVSLLFTQAEVNGTLARVAQRTQQLCRGNLGLIPVTFFLLALLLGTAGPGNIAVAGLLAPVAMAAAHRAGIPAFLMAILVGHGAIACTLSPFTPAGVVAGKILTDIGLGGHEWRIYASNALANASVGLGGYLLFGGWKLFGKWQVDAAPGSEPSMGEPSGAPAPLRMARSHRLTLLVIASLVAGVVLGKAHIGMAAFAGAAVLSLLGLADERETFRKVPWNVILMVCGVSVLTSLLEKTGGTQRFAELIHTVSTPGTLPGVLAFVTGIVSVYSSTTGVVLPAFLPMVKTIVEVQPASDPLALALSVIIGGNLVDMSPLSTIGALCVAGAAAGTDRRALFNQLLAWGCALSLISAVLCWTYFSLV